MIDSIYINNFFHGILLRGIPIYAENLLLGIRVSGRNAKMFSCSPLFHSIPRGFLNIFFVIFEQLVFPISAMRSKKTIYPYNSVSIIDSLLGRSVLIIHDFIPNHKSDRSLAARYIRFTQQVHALLGRDVAFVSKSTAKIARRLKAFPKSKKYYLPNTFYMFQELAMNVNCLAGDYILLCSGRGPNKDLIGALELAYSSNVFANAKIRILGLAGDRSLVDKWCKVRSLASDHIHVCGKLSDLDVLKEYKSSRWVWVHSLAEGYGRSIAEAKICGKYVLASDIPPFREQISDTVFLYRNRDQFLLNANRVEMSVNRKIEHVLEPVEHTYLRNELEVLF